MTTPQTTEKLNPAIERHPLEFFIPDGATLMMLGSFPPKRERWSMDFYYPNLQNDMWRIFGIVFFSDRFHFMNPNRKIFDRDRIVSFLTERGIALGDTAREVVRLMDNASDKFLRIVTPFDLSDTLERVPACRAFVTTGQKATDIFTQITGAVQPKVGGFTEFEYNGRPLRLYRMPSSSRAYPLSIDKKAVCYEKMFREMGLKA